MNGHSRKNNPHNHHFHHNQTPVGVILLLLLSFFLGGFSSIASAFLLDNDAEYRRRDAENQQHAGSGGIQWRDLSVSLRKTISEQGSKDKSLDVDISTVVLKPSSGMVENGHICGIIGPSGCGKSTLLAALSGTTLKGSGKQVMGSVWMKKSTPSSYGEEHENMNCVSMLSMSDGDVAFLQQHDTFFSMLTPRETIDLAAFLQLDHTRINKGEREIMVDGIVDSLGLRHVQSRRIGGESLNGSSNGSGGMGNGGGGGGGSGSLSGGERRRLSVALELVTNPKVFLADEPTTGLDSAQAQKVVNIIAKVAKDRNIPCILSIHQPRASIWKTLDSFILLGPGGKMIYMGKRTEAVPYFKKLGYNCPPETNPAEFFIDLVTIDTEDSTQMKIDQERINVLAEEFQQQLLRENTTSHGITSGIYDQYSSSRTCKKNVKSKKQIQSHRRPFIERISVLLIRSLKQNIRDMKVNILRLGASVGLATLFSELFRTVKKGAPIAKSVADRTALLSFGVINMVMLALMKTLNLFGKEKAVVMREQMRKQYSSFDYLLSKALAELPLDMIFSTVFAAVLKHLTSLRIPFSSLSGTLSLMTVAGASLGFAVGSVTSNVEEAMTVGMPIAIILMAVGIINPSGVDVNAKTPIIIKILQKLSPIKLAIEALLIAEYKGMKFNDGKGRWNVRDLPRMGGLALVQSGDQVLDALNLSTKTYQGVMKDLLLLSGFNLLISWVGLQYCGPEFLIAKPLDVATAQEVKKNDSTRTTATKEKGGGRSKTKNSDSVMSVPLFRWS